MDLVCFALVLLFDEEGETDGRFQVRSSQASPVGRFCFCLLLLLVCLFVVVLFVVFFLGGGGEGCRTIALYAVFFFFFFFCANPPVNSVRTINPMIEDTLRMKMKRSSIFLHFSPGHYVTSSVMFEQ